MQIRWWVVTPEQYYEVNLLRNLGWYDR